MARYLISYRRPGESVETYEISGKSEAEARTRFLNLGWVVFTEISIIAAEPILAVEPAADPAPPAQAPVVRTAPQSQPPVDWRAECDALTEDIGRLADQAQADDRVGRHAAAKRKRQRAKDLAATRAAITKRSKGK